MEPHNIVENRSDQHEAALDLLNLGFAVFPCEPRGKRPITTNGFKNATEDFKQINRWWDAWPKANPAIALGETNLVVDFDSRKAHASFTEEFGNHKTVTSNASRGPHLYFKKSADLILKNAAGFRDGLDVKTVGGYVMAPGAVHESGHIYNWEKGLSPRDIEFAPLPACLVEALSKGRSPARLRQGSSSKNEGVVKSLRPTLLDIVREGAVEGIRNESTARLAGYLLRHYIEPETALEFILLWNAHRCNSPLEEAEVLRTVDSIAGLELARRTKAGTT